VHELALAAAVLRIAEQHGRGRRVVRVELEIGELRQVVPEALEFSFAIAANGTPAEGAELTIEKKPIVVSCDACRVETRLATFPLACGRCGSRDVQLRSGEELSVVALELEEEPVAAVGRST
jgi:hydrogenase nickel incorporation protein HypA/HybF